MKPTNSKLTSLLTAAAAAVLFLAGQARPADAIPPPYPRDVEAERIARTYLRRFGKSYKARHDPARSLVYVSALDDDHYAETANLLGAYGDAFCKTLAVSRPRRAVTVLLPTVDDYRPLAPAKNITGFYKPAERLLVSIDRGKVLVHEFTHALHHADCLATGQNHPIWVWEGLATLLESSHVGPAGLEPYVDTRLLRLQKAIRLKRAIRLERLVAMKPDAFMRDAELSYAEARYLMLYLHQKGKLAQWYAAYKAGFADDPTGKSALEEVLAKRLFQVDKDWRQWASKLRLPLGQRRAGEARLGLQVRNTRNGVKVVGFNKGSAAQRAGRLEVGDFILKFNGLATRNSGEVVAAIQSAGAMQTATIELRRKGRVMTIRQPLGRPQVNSPGGQTKASGGK